MKKRKISVIVPVYKAEKYIKECIESVIAQIYENWELILISDGSPDNSYNICQQYASQDCRIVAVEKENSGVSDTRNLGISMANGEYIAFIDSDDFVAPDYLSKLESFMKENIGMVALGLNSYSEEKGVKLITSRMQKGEISYNQLKKIIIDDGSMSGFSLHSSCAVLYRKKIINENKLKFNSCVKYNEDGLFTTEYALLAKMSAYIDLTDAVYFYRTNESSATHTVDLMSQKYSESMKEIEKALEQYRDLNNQLEKRSVTICLSKIIYLTKKNKLTYSILKTLLKDNKVQKGLKVLNISLMNTRKKIICICMKLHLYLLIYYGMKCIYRS